MKNLAPLQYPQFFQGVFARRRERFIPLIEEARRVLHALPVPEALRPFYDTVVRDNPQPSFLLLPLIFLATAEASGGIQASHRRYLPFMMLSMEACAISDDTVDCTPMRSGRPSFPMRFGEASTTPFVSTLVALAAKESARIDPGLLDATMRFFVELHACQLWERHHPYPPRTCSSGGWRTATARACSGPPSGSTPPCCSTGGRPPPPACWSPSGASSRTSTTS